MVNKYQKYDSLYSIGYNKNFKQVFGLNKILWFFPYNDISGYPMGNGIEWGSNYELEDIDFLEASKDKSSDINNKNINSNETIDFNNAINDFDNNHVKNSFSVSIYYY